MINIKKNLYNLISKCLDVQHIFEATKRKNEIIYIFVLNINWTKTEQTFKLKLTIKKNFLQLGKRYETQIK